jgi:hypothetical protein
VVRSGCLTYFDAEGRKRGHACTGPIPSVEGIHSAKADSTAVVRIKFCHPDARGNLLERCD